MSRYWSLVAGVCGVMAACVARRSGGTSDQAPEAPEAVAAVPPDDSVQAAGPGEPDSHDSLVLIRVDDIRATCVPVCSPGGAVEDRWQWVGRASVTNASNRTITIRHNMVCSAMLRGRYRSTEGDLHPEMPRLWTPRETVPGGESWTLGSGEARSVAIVLPPVVRWVGLEGDGRAPRAVQYDIDVVDRVHDLEYVEDDQRRLRVVDHGGGWIRYRGRGVCRMVWLGGT